MLKLKQSPLLKRWKGNAGGCSRFRISVEGVQDSDCARGMEKKKNVSIRIRSNGYNKKCVHEVVIFLSRANIAVLAIHFV